MLTGPLFMLQVYDRVLTSRSEATLVALIILVAFLFLMMGILDYARGRVLARAGARLQARLDPRVLRAILVRSISPDERARPATGLRDLEAIHRFSSGSGPFAFFDAPWTPIFLFLLFTFHWLCWGCWQSPRAACSSCWRCSTRWEPRGWSEKSARQPRGPGSSSTRCARVVKPSRDSGCTTRSWNDPAHCGTNCSTVLSRCRIESVSSV